MGYKWTSKGSATGYSFTYNNTIYQYDSINNKLISQVIPPRKLDLMFVLRNLENAQITNNELKVYVNYYKLH